MILRDALFSFRSERLLQFGAAAFVSFTLATYIAITSLWDGIANQALPFPDGNQIVQVSKLGAGASTQLASEQTADLATATSQLDWLHHAAEVPITLRGGTFPETVGLLLVTRGLLRDLGTSPLQGRLFRDESHTRGQVPEDFLHARHMGQPEVIVSHRFWKSRLGSAPNLDDLQLNIQGLMGSATMTLQVVGVMPEGFFFPTERVDLWYPLATPDVTTMSDERQRGRQTVMGPMGFGWGRIAPDSSIVAAASELRSLHERAISHRSRRAPISSREETIELTSFRQTLVAPLSPALVLLRVASALLLAICAFSVLGLMASACMARERDRAIRIAVGSTPLREAGLMVARVGLQAFAICCVAFATSFWLLRWISSRVAVAGPAVDVAPGTVVTALLLATILTGVAEAHSLRHVLATVLPQVRPDRRRQSTHRRWALISGVTASTALLGVVGAFALSARNLVEGLGSYPADTVVVDIGHEPGEAAVLGDRKAEQALVERVLALSTVESVAVAEGTPEQNRGLHATMQDDNGPWHYRVRRVSAQYFETLRLPVIRGRAFRANDVQSEPRLVVDAAFADRYDREILNHPIRGACLGSCIGTVIGIVRSEPQFPDREMVPTVYRLTTAEDSSLWGALHRPRFVLLVRTVRDPEPLLAGIRAAVHGALPGVIALRVQTARELRQELLRDGLVLMAALAVLGVGALLLSFANCWGHIAEHRQRTRHSNAIRAAIGASPSQLRWELIRKVGFPGAVGIGLGAISSVVLHQVLAHSFAWLGPVQMTSLVSPAAVVGVTITLQLMLGRSHRYDRMALGPTVRAE